MIATVVLYLLAAIGLLQVVGSVVKVGRGKAYPVRFRGKRTRRITLDVSSECAHKLENLRVLGEHMKIERVFRYALAIYDLQLHAHAEGDQIILRSPDGTERILEIE